MYFHAKVFAEMLWGRQKAPTLQQVRRPQMLILTRRKGETIIINDDIRLTLLEIKGNQCKIGIEAPSDVDIHREEIYKRVDEASDTNDADT